MTISLVSPIRVSPPLLRGAAIALVVWFVGMTALALVIKPETVVAFGQPAAMALAAADADGQLLTSGRGFVALRTGHPDTVRRLYAGGAFLVWPVLGAGCRGAAKDS